MRHVPCAVAALLGAACLGEVAAQPAPVRLPDPPGPYPVGTVTYEWEDTTRRMGVAPREDDVRTIIVQIWYPAEDLDAPKAPYSALSADYRHVEANSTLRPSFSEAVASSPLVLLSPGRGVERYGYTTIAEALASDGYVVASVDMPQLGYVIYQDGFIARPNPEFQPSRELMAGPYEKVDEFFERPTEMGRRDLELAWSKLRELNREDPSGRFVGRIDTANVGIFGHSLGGRIAGAFAETNQHVNAYISMEGIAPRRARLNGLPMPVAMLCSSGTWPYARENYQALIDGRKNTVFMIRLESFGHNSVTDFPFVTPDQFGYEVEPRKGLLTSAAIVRAFFDSTLTGDGDFKALCGSLPNVVIAEHPAVAGGQNADPEVSDPRASATAMPMERALAIDAFIERFVGLAMFDGTVLIDVKGDLVFERSFGRAQYEFDVPHDEHTRFRIASVSKSLTDAAFARLVEREVIDLESRLSDYLPNFPSAEKITLSQLLDHTSGIPHSNDQPWGEDSLTITEIVEKLARLPLDFEPGTDRNYSNGGYAVAARALEVVGGGTFSEVMREIVFDPLEMEDTDHITDARSPTPRLAIGYEPGLYPGQRRRSRPCPVESRPGGGSFYSTADDLLRFMRAVFRGGFVSADLRRDVMGADGDSFLAQGRSPGFVAKLYYDAREDVIVVSLANSYAVPAGWAARLTSLATGAPSAGGWPELELAAPEVRADDPRLGRYRSSRGGLEMVIERSDLGVMTMAATGNGSITALVPLADGSFLMPLYFQRCTQDPETRVITCTMLSGDSRYTSTLTPIPDARGP